MTGPVALRCCELAVGHRSGPVLSGITLQLDPGHTLAVLGASGSGKSTLLHTIAGFLTPWNGTVELDGTVVAGGRLLVPPERRSVGVVFQDYGLWPHLSALDNVAYPLRRQGSSRRTARAEAARLLGVLHVGDAADRNPAELSGGQQQRVGLARALARRARLYLLDEPTAHLDTHLRALLLDEIDRHRTTGGAASVLATHDAAEALAVADVVAVLDRGRVAQVGTPRQVYEEPVSLAVARLTGPADAVVRAHGVSVVRPEWVRLDAGEARAPVVRAMFRGSCTDYTLDTPSGTLTARELGPPRHAAGVPVLYTITREWFVRGLAGDV